jgi:AAA+ lid domain
MHKLCAATYSGTNNGSNNNTVAANELALVWVHECCNVYADKLISVKDVKVYQVSGLDICVMYYYDIRANWQPSSFDIAYK